MRRSPEKVARNAAIVAAHAGGATILALSRQHGVSRERIRQIIERAAHRPGGIHTRRPSSSGGDA